MLRADLYVLLCEWLFHRLQEPTDLTLNVIKGPPEVSPCSEPDEGTEAKYVG